MTPAARLQAAVELLTAVGETARPADRVIADWFKPRRFVGAKDRRAITLTVYAVLRAQARLGWWLARPQPSARLQVFAWLALVDGWRADDFAGRLGQGAHALSPPSETELRALEPLIGHSLDHPRQPPAVQVELPDWLFERLGEDLGAAAPAELAALRGEAPVDLRANVLKADRASARAALAAEGIETTPGRWSPWALRADGRRPVAATAAFRDGLVEVQDEGSQLVALLTGAQPGQRVCDFCAGAGGKTLALAAAMQNKGQLFACDVLDKRLERSAVRLRRAGVHNVTRKPIESERDPWVKRHKGGFDRVLVDAPCSGSGTWRRNPEARWRLTPEGLDELLDLQGRILESAARLVRPGGRLAYATCSLLRAENEAQVERFLAADPAFRLLPMPQVWAEVLGGDPPGEAPMLRLLPAAHGTDGFFLAVLERLA